MDGRESISAKFFRSVESVFGLWNSLGIKMRYCRSLACVYPGRACCFLQWSRKLRVRRLYAAISAGPRSHLAVVCIIGAGRRACQEHTAGPWIRPCV